MTILINKEAIDEVKHVKYLGILIDSQLTFKYHIDELNKKVSRAICILYKLRPFVTSKILSNVYNAIFYPFLLYGIEVWGNTNNSPRLYLYLTEKNYSNGNFKKMGTHLYQVLYFINLDYLIFLTFLNFS